MLLHSQNSKAGLNKCINNAALPNNVSKPNKSSAVHVSEDTDTAA